MGLNEDGRGGNAEGKSQMGLTEAIENGKINAEKHDRDERLMAENERRRNREDM